MSIHKFIGFAIIAVAIVQLCLVTSCGAYQCTELANCNPSSIAPAEFLTTTVQGSSQVTINVTFVLRTYGDTSKCGSQLAPSVTVSKRLMLGGSGYGDYFNRPCYTVNHITVLSTTLDLNVTVWNWVEKVKVVTGVTNGTVVPLSDVFCSTDVSYPCGDIAAVLSSAA